MLIFKVTDVSKTEVRTRVEVGGDLSDKKSYAEVPAMLRISSDLALRRAFKLIELL